MRKGQHMKRLIHLQITYHVRAEASRQWLRNPLLSTFVFFALTVGSSAIQAAIPDLIIDKPITLIDETRTSVGAEAGDNKIFVSEDGFIEGADVVIGGESNRIASVEPGAIGLEQPLAIAHSAGTLVSQNAVFSNLTVTSRLTVVATRFIDRSPQPPQPIFKVPVRGDLIVASGGILISANRSNSTKRLLVQFEVSSNVIVDGRVGREGNSRLKLVALSGSVTIRGTDFPGARLEISAGTDVKTGDLSLELLALKDIGGNVTTGAITATGVGDSGWIVIDNVGGNVSTGALTGTNTDVDQVSFVIVSDVGGSVTTGALATTGATDAFMILSNIGASSTVGALTATAFDVFGFGWISISGLRSGTGITTGAISATGGDEGNIDINFIRGSVTTGSITATGSGFANIHIFRIEGSVTTDALSVNGGGRDVVDFIDVQATGDLTFHGPVIINRLQNEPAAEGGISLSSLEGKISINEDVTTEDDTLCVSAPVIEIASGALLSAARSRWISRNIGWSGNLLATVETDGMSGRHIFRLSSKDDLHIMNFGNPFTPLPYIIVEEDPPVDEGCSDWLEYAALGESYSSGEGARDYFEETSKIRVNQCHRSRRAYATQIKDPLHPGRLIPLNPDAFVACSGALTFNVARGQPGAKNDKANAPAQLDKVFPEPDGRFVVNNSTDMLTIGIGGNDAGFAEVLELCIFERGNCEADDFMPYLHDNLNPPELRSLNEIIDAKRLETEGLLRDLYLQILGQVGSNTAVFVLGYPQVVGGKCGIAFLKIDEEELAFIRQATENLNDVIEATAREVGLHFVEVANHFAGHGACSKDPWIKGLSVPKVESFHPTSKGQKQIAIVLNQFIDDKIRSGWPLLPSGLPRTPFFAGGLPQTPLFAVSAARSAFPGQLTAIAGADQTPQPSFADLDIEPDPPMCDTRGSYIPGQRIRLEGTGYAPGGSVVVRIAAEGGALSETLAIALVDSAGAIGTSVTIPFEAPVDGFALIRAFGRRSDGGILDRSQVIQLAPSLFDDLDGDWVPDICDNCAAVGNEDQSDSDSDGIGDVCDACPFDPEDDLDGDGLCADVDECEYDPENDIDGDGLCAEDDNCPRRANPDQLDSNGDGVGDVCENTPPDCDGAVAVPDLLWPPESPVSARSCQRCARPRRRFSDNHRGCGFSRRGGWQSSRCSAEPVGGSGGARRRRKRSRLHSRVHRERWRSRHVHRYGDSMCAT